ncbi:conjugal transfer protein [Nocardiopsis sp. RSe5-2]|uniref:Conjugal transfer protein n=1 Tax=Nocardiopsis endophytica TaxID=3018445 RepID=A0ABT4TXN3_9ACTN|nr:conjugal transfer protein [Nocardiopsis endophytica]MDA2809440.1 conjugal transfer protein [Nocardiopsis endophytica]
MARRSTARSGGTPEAADAADDVRGGAGRLRRPRAGSGGRWWVWVGRAVLWAFIIVVLFNGVWHPLREGIATPSDDGGSQEEPQEAQFPEAAAGAFAGRFAEHYLNAPEDGAEADRAAALAAFVPEGDADEFNVPAGSLTGSEIQVVTVTPEDDNNAVVTLSAQVNGEPMSLDVPVYAEDATSLVVSGPPALLAAPDKAELPEASGVEADSDAREELEPVLTSFFEAYAETPEHLTRYVENGASVARLPQGSLEFGQLDDVVVPARTDVGEDDVRQATATVEWRIPGGGGEAASLTQSYRITVVRTDGEWYVRDLQGAPQSFGR